MEKIAGNSSVDVRLSKKRPESVHSVICNEDLLMEILVGLPILSLLLFKSVSKQWLSLIKSPNFTTRLTRKLDPPCGLFLKFDYYPFKYDFVPLDIRIPSASHFGFGRKAPPGNLEILQSCNGLLLCHSSSCKKLFVCNPSFKCVFKIIPEPPNATFDPTYLTVTTRMAFDSTKSPHYKVIHFELRHDNVVGSSVQIYIYTSETGVWSVCGDRFDIKILRCFRDGVYWSDAIHWVNDSWPALHFKLDILNERPVLTTFKIPFTLDWMDYCDFKLFKSRGCLLLLHRGNSDSKELYVYEMSNGCSEWSVKYIVNLDDITVPLPKRWSIRSNVHCIVLGEREDDSFIVMKLSEKVVQYKIVSKTLRTLVNSGISGVVDGMDVVKAIKKSGLSGRATSKPVVISDCYQVS